MKKLRGILNNHVALNIKLALNGNVQLKNAALVVNVAFMKEVEISILLGADIVKRDGINALLIRSRN